jgi:ABC-type transporter Mla subunit MlaD
VRSVSAIGEQYVDLRPRTDSGPYLGDGSVIEMDNTTIPQAVGPMLDQLSSLVDTIPKDKLSQLLDEAYNAFNGAGYDFGSLIDNAAKLAGEANAYSDQTRSLIDDSGPLLDSQAETTDSIRTWARSLAGVTEQVAANDPDIRAILQRGPGFAAEVSGLLKDVKPTLPVLLANLTTLGQVLVTYNPALEQILVVAPAYIAAQQAFGLPRNNPTGLPSGDFSLTVGDPPPCTVGFLPPSQWRNPEDTTTIDTPEGLYCKLPQDSPIAVRGARNYPCMNNPGKRAPTALRSAPATSRSNRLRCGNIRWVRTRSTPIWCRRAFRLTTVSTSTTAYMRPWRARPCRRVRSAGTPPGPPPATKLAPPPPASRMGHRRVRRHPCQSRPDAVRATAAPPPPGNSLNGVPIPLPRRRRSRMVVQSPPRQRVQPQHNWRTVGRDRPLRPERALRHPRARWSSRPT